MSLTLHKVAVLSDEEEGHQFTFVFESPHKLLESKSIESSEIHYAGHSWSLVCTRKEDRYLGIFLKWRYTDGNSATAVSTKCKYFMTLVHRHDYNENKKFVTTQKFTTAQPLLGKSKFILLEEMLDQGSGYLDDVGKHIIIELGFSHCSTRFDQVVDVSPANRTRKNASGVYFDTTTFVLANHRWYLRFYTMKVNSSGLPAVYLYLSGKARGVSLELRFTLSLCNDSTEILTYNFGEGAKFDGFGKTLLESLPNANKLTEATVSVEITSLMIFKCAPIKFFQQPLSSTSRFQRKDGYASYNGSYNGLYSGGVGSSLALVEAFQDHEGNFWKTDVVRDAKKLTIVVDKGVHHFPNNKTKMVCWSVVLLSLDQQRAPDVNMTGFPVVGSFSNFTDDRGYLMTFPLLLTKLEEAGNPYMTESGEIFIRINFLSLQTTSLVVRSGPRFDYQLNHLLLARQELQENHRSLMEMREMSASHASLSMLDDPPMSEGSLSSGQTGMGGQSRTALSKSLDSLDALSSGDLPMTEEEDYHRFLFSDLLRCFAETDLNDNKRHADDVWVTSRREVVSMTREDSIGDTTGSSTASDESSSLLSGAGANVVETRKQSETVRNIVKYLQQRLPLRITEVIELGSLGTGTVAKSRVDADLILFSPSVPARGQSQWMPAVLRCFQTSIMEGSNNQDPFYPLPRCSDFTLSPSALQFSCDGIDIDVQLTFDWDSEAGGGSYDAIFEASCKAVSKQDRLWYKLACSRLQKKFLCDQPNEVKEMIKVVKQWRNSIQWKKTAYRPNSYLLSLLVIKAHEETRSLDIKRILQKMASFILAAELSLSWTLYYVPEKYQVEFDPPTPMVRDPTNPAINVAESLPYWGQLRTEYAAWIRSLGITVSPLGS